MAGGLFDRFLRELRRWGPSVLALLVGLGIIGVSHVRGHLVRTEWMGGLLWLIPAVLAGEFYLVFRRRPDLGGVERELLPGAILAAAMLLYLYSSAATHRQFFFLKWSPGPTLESAALDSWAGKTMLLTAVLTPLFLFRWRWRGGLLLVALVLSQVLCFARLSETTKGATLYGFDHPAIMQRLAVFARTFPQMVCYDPMWNGGKAVAYLMASAIAPLGSVFWPIWRFATIHQVYTPVLAFMCVVFVPLVTAAAVRFARGSWPAAWAGALLALGVSRVWFIWLLHFGTAGSCLALTFSGLVAACLYRVLWLGERDIKTGVALVIGSLMLLAWPPACIVAAALLLAALAGVREWKLRSLLFLAVCGAVIALLFFPYARGLFEKAHVGYFVERQDNPFDAAAVLGAGWTRLVRSLMGAHPALVFLGLAGAFFLPARGVRPFFGVALVVVLAASSWGKEFRPQLELSRLVVAILYIAAVPAGLWAGRLLESGSVRLAPVQAFLVALLAFGGLNVSRYYANRMKDAQYRVMSPEITRLADWIRANVPEDGRVMFMGSATHAFGGGTVAYLPVMTGREMMACDYYQFSPRLVEYEYPPKDYRRKPERIMDFAELYNVTHVITHHPRWIRNLKKSPELFEEVYDFSNERRQKLVYRVKRDSNMFLKGSGTARATVNAIRVSVDDPGGEVVVKYNWSEGLAADRGVDIRPYEAGTNVTLIAAHPHGRKDFTIRYRRRL